MPRFTEWNAENVAIAQTPNALPVKRIKIDLSVERTPALNNCVVWNVQGLYLRNAAEQNAGSAQVSIDAGANEGNLTQNNFFLTGGEVENFPFSKVVISNTAQVDRFLYLEVTDKFELLAQPITNPRESVDTLDVLNKATAGGVVLGDIQGEFDGAFKKRDFIMASDESHEAGNREWAKNLKKGALINPTGNVFFRNYTTGFNQFNRVTAAQPNYYQIFLTAAETGNLMGGNVGYEAFYKVKFFANFSDLGGSNNGAHVVDTALYFGGSGFGVIRPSVERVTTVKNGTLSSTNTTMEYPVFVIPANRTNDMVLGLIISPTYTGVVIDRDTDFACEWQRVERY